MTAGGSAPYMLMLAWQAIVVSGTVRARLLRGRMEVSRQVHTHEAVISRYEAQSPPGLGAPSGARLPGAILRPSGHDPST